MTEVSDFRERPRFTRPLLSVALWFALLAAITAAGALWLVRTGRTPADFSVAIVVIAYSPSIAAGLVAGTLGRLTGLKALFRQILPWRVGIG